MPVKQFHGRNFLFVYLSAFLWVLWKLLLHSVYRKLPGDNAFLCDHEKTRKICNYEVSNKAFIEKNTKAY